MRAIWEVPSDVELQRSTSAWFLSIIEAAPGRMIDAILLIAWRIWYVHNEVTHAKPLPPVDISKNFLSSYIRTLRDIKVLSTKDMIKGKHVLLTSDSNPHEVIQKNIHVQRCLKPALGRVKLNCDGSFKQEDGTAGAGMILRDDTGKVIFSACRQLFNCEDPFEAEAKACEEGIRLASQWSEKPVMVELDCSALIGAISEKNLDRSSLAYLIAEIRDLVF
jgi:hypothetical protein